MKKIIFILSLFVSVNLHAQDKIYVHTATAANIASNWTTIDHPALNGNPDAPIVFVHNYNPSGLSGVYNDHVTGLWYSSGKWNIFNEDATPMVEGSSYNIYIASNPAQVFTHVSDGPNTVNNITRLDNTLLNGLNPGPIIVMSNYFNPNGVYNPANIGQYYDGVSSRALYREDQNNANPGAAYKVLVNGGAGSTAIRHTSTASNITNNWTIIDNPKLNGKPNAAFVMSHYWGVNGPATQGYLDHTLGVYYDGSHWAIYIEDPINPFPENVVFDIIIAPRQEAVGIEENQINEKISMFPNPVMSTVSFTAPNRIDKVNLYNILGQKVLSQDGKASKLKMDISSISAGIYFAEISTEGKTQMLRLVKD